MIIPVTAREVGQRAPLEELIEGDSLLIDPSGGWAQRNGDDFVVNGLYRLTTAGAQRLGYKVALLSTLLVGAAACSSDTPSNPSPPPPGPQNNPPVLGMIGARQTDEGVPLQRIVLTSSDPDPGDTREFYIQNAPPGSQFNAVLGQFDWTPNGNQSGVHEVLFGVRDGAGATDDEVVSITVNDTLEPFVPPPGFFNAGMVDAETGVHLGYSVQPEEELFVLMADGHIASGRIRKANVDLYGGNYPLISNRFAGMETFMSNGSFWQQWLEGTGPVIGTDVYGAELEAILGPFFRDAEVTYAIVPASNSSVNITVEANAGGFGFQGAPGPRTGGVLIIDNPNNPNWLKLITHECFRILGSDLVGTGVYSLGGAESYTRLEMDLAKVAKKLIGQPVRGQETASNALGTQNYNLLLVTNPMMDAVPNLYRILTTGPGEIMRVSGLVGPNGAPIASQDRNESAYRDAVLSVQPAEGLSLAANGYKGPEPAKKLEDNAVLPEGPREFLKAKAPHAGLN